MNLIWLCSTTHSEWINASILENNSKPSLSGLGRTISQDPPPPISLWDLGRNYPVLHFSFICFLYLSCMHLMYRLWVTSEWLVVTLSLVCYSLVMSLGPLLFFVFTHESTANFEDRTTLHGLPRIIWYLQQGCHNLEPRPSSSSLILPFVLPLDGMLHPWRKTATTNKLSKLYETVFN